MARDAPTPKSYREALSGEFATAWNAAELRELKSLKDQEDQEVWEWCEPALEGGGAHAIGATWDWGAEPASEGFVDKVTARLCARALREVYGLKTFLGRVHP